MGVNSVSWAPYVAPCSLFDNVDHQIGDANSDHQNGGAPGRPYMRLVTGGSDNLVKIWKYRYVFLVIYIYRFVFLLETGIFNF